RPSQEHSYQSPYGEYHAPYQKQPPKSSSSSRQQSLEELRRLEEVQEMRQELQSIRRDFNKVLQMIQSQAEQQERDKILKSIPVPDTQELQVVAAPEDVPIQESEPELPCAKVTVHEVWNADLFEDSELCLISEDVLTVDYMPTVAPDLTCLQ